MKSMKKLVYAALLLLIVISVLSLAGCDVGYFIPMLTGSEPPDTTLAVPTEVTDRSPDTTEPSDTDSPDDEPSDDETDSTDLSDIESSGDDSASGTESGTASPDTVPANDQIIDTLPAVTV